MMNHQQRSEVLERIAEDAVPAGIDLWPALNTELKARRPSIGNRRAAVTRIGRRGWTVAATAVLALAALAASLLPTWSGTETVSAETVLDRAAAVASGASVTTYHLVMTRQDFVKGSETAQSEVWFGGAERQRTRERVTDASGATVMLQDVVFNGSETWIVTTQNGQTGAIHTIGTDWTRPADDPAGQGNLADLLSRYGDKGCMAARLLQSQASVAGWSTYELEVAPKRVVPCGVSPAVSPVASPVASAAHVSGQVPASRVENVGAPVVHVWVDKQSFLALQTEVRDASGALIQRSQVSQLEYNVTIPDSTFAYSPPTGVTVSTFQGGNGADVKRALHSAPDLKQSRPPGN